MELSNKIATLLQFAYRAGKLYFGESNIIKMMSNQVKILVVAKDVSPSQEKKYLSKAEFYNVRVIRYLSKEDLGALFGKNEVACVGISDANMAKEIKRLSE
mgnify:CR=1 FL=1